MADTKKCPWCAEEILAEAKKCKHCGEFLTDERPTRSDPDPEGAHDIEGTDPAAGEGAQATTHPPERPRRSVAQSRPVWRFGASGWGCIKHGKPDCVACRLIVAAPKQPGEQGDQYPVRNQYPVVESEPPKHACPTCQQEFTGARDLYLHKVNVHGAFETDPDHRERMRPKGQPVQHTSYSGAPGQRKRVSEVGSRTPAGLACPRCGGTQFTAKRSAKGKVIGFTTLGVGGLIAPKSRVKCVTCGMMFLRG